MEISAELINQFKEFTGSTNDAVARSTLIACDGNLEQAVGLFFASDGAIGTQNIAPEARANDDEDVVEIDPRNNGAVAMNDSQMDYQNGIRNPMAPVSGRLVDQSFQDYYADHSRRTPANPIFEQYHDLIPGTGHRRRQAQAATSTRSENSQTTKKGSRDLATLFRPPIDIIARLDWNSLLQAGRQQNRWVLVNIQDPSEFPCQVLNRDCWSNTKLKELIKSKLLFWQVYQDAADGRRVVGYYGVNEYPSIFIVDPRTSELIQHIKTQDPKEMFALLSNFCESYPTFAAYDIELRSKMKAVKPPSV